MCSFQGTNCDNHSIMVIYGLKWTFPSDWRLSFSFTLWAQVDSNHRPHAYQACALTSWAMSPYLRLEAVGFSLPLSPFCAMQSFHFTQLRVHSASWFRKLCARLVCRFNRLVEMNGIEPMTPCLQSRCSPSWATPPYSIEHEASLRWRGFLHSLEVPFQGLQN